MASLQHLGGDRWRVRVYVGTDQGTERLISRTFRANGVRKAKDAAAAVETDLRREYKAAQAEAAIRRGSVAELVDDWLSVKRRDRSPSTMLAYERHAKRIKERFGKIQAVDITGRDIDAWYGELMAGGMTAANVQHVHRVLRAVLRFGHKKRDLPSIATDKASPPSHQTPEVVPPSSGQIMTMLLDFPAGPDRQWPRAVRLLVFTGLRRGEVVGLKWSNWTPATDTTPGRLKVEHSIVEVKGGVHVGPPKGKRTREFALDPQADLVLDQQRRYLERHGLKSQWVFPDFRTDTTGKTPRRPGWVSLMFNRWRSERICRPDCELCDGNGKACPNSQERAPDLHLHALRHHFATMLLDRQVPLNTVQRQLGHADASTTLRIYGHRTEEGEQQSLDASSAVFGSIGAGSSAPSAPSE